MHNKRPVKGKRIVAAIIDVLFFTLLTMLIGGIFLPLFGLEVADPLEFINNGDFDFGTHPTPVAAVIETITFFAIGIVYYAYIPFMKDGKTPGKIIMKIKAIDETGANPSFKRHLARAIELYSYYISVPALVLIFFDLNTFLWVNTIIIAGTFLLFMISLTTIFTRLDERGVHDMIAKTYVVSEDYDPEAPEEDDHGTKKLVWDEDDDEEEDFMKGYEKEDIWKR